MRRAEHDQCERCHVRSSTVREIHVQTGLVIIEDGKRRGFRLCRACRRFWGIEVLKDIDVPDPPPKADTFDEAKCSCRVVRVRQGELHDLGCKGFAEPVRLPLVLVDEIATSPAAASVPPPAPPLRELDAVARTLPLFSDDAGQRAIADVLEQVDPPEGT